jgi:predicted Holliday junction resolvase-like endonuclease
MQYLLLILIIILVILLLLFPHIRNNTYHVNFSADVAQKKHKNSIDARIDFVIKETRTRENAERSQTKKKITGVKKK